MLKKSNILVKNKYDRWNLPMAIILLLLVFYCAVRLDLNVDVQYNIIPLIAYIISSVGVIAILLICKYIKRLPLVSYYGRYSIIILVTHDLLYRTLRVVVGRMHCSIVAFEWIQLFFVLAVSLIIIPLFVKYIPKLTAQDDLITIKT